MRVRNIARGLDFNIDDSGHASVLDYGPNGDTFGWQFVVVFVEWCRKGLTMSELLMLMPNKV